MGFWLALALIALVVFGRVSRAAAAARVRAGQSPGAAPGAPGVRAFPAAPTGAAAVGAAPLVTLQPVARSPEQTEQPGPERIEVTVDISGRDGSLPPVPRQPVSTAPPPSPRARSPARGPAMDRYVGSAALESTLDSTIDSSLLGIPTGPVTAALLPGAAALELPDELRVQVISFLADGQEVAAVRLVCDELDCSIIEAVQTVHSVS